MFNRLYRQFSNDIGIDLGTANTLVYLRGRGIVINEPSVVALNTKTNRVVAVGMEAKNMMGRTPSHIRIVRPLVEGVISDYEVTEEMLSYLINKANDADKKLFRPRVVIGIPVGITNVEMRAVYDAAKSAGAREVYIVEEPMAAAIGVQMPIHDPVGSMIIDIGGGTTDIAVIALSGIVRAKSLKIAGDRLTQDIISYMRDEFKMLIGEKTAEHIKITVGSALPDEIPEEISIKGRDLVTGLPREAIITDVDIREAMYASISQLVDAIREVLETTPPEVLADIMQKGMMLAGGGALIRNLPQLLESQLKVPVTIVDDPLTAVARGTGIILENVNLYKDVLVENTDDISFR
ncbi:MAG: rod shape-determining protein MreB, rod shape-determining protein MreB-related protein [Candidatus Nomurabacteria bacterium]|nr:rod shape-determining protein MreB, rod shape-determining protein MreB-related protein [Candidatus Nomurabacteria bacterium]